MPMPDGKVLILALCSNHKATVGGTDEYVSDGRAFADVMPGRRQRLMGARREVLQLIQGGLDPHSEQRLADLPYNRRLVWGSDFGADSSASYMAAVLRYQGRFYQELCADRRETVLQSKRHMLIVSALYGLVCPAEPIQLYTCHVHHHPSIRDVWRDRGNTLTAMLLAYIVNNGIGLVLDVMGESSYRRLIDWDQITSRTRVLHAYGCEQAGPRSLPALGQLSLEWLLEDEPHVLRLHDGERCSTDYGQVLLSSATEPPPDVPREEECGLPPDGGEEQPMAEIVVVASEPRNIEVRTAGDHGSMFGPAVHSFADLPGELRGQMETISQILDVSAIHLGAFSSAARPSKYGIRLSDPVPGKSCLRGKIVGHGCRGTAEDLWIHVRRGRERAVHGAIHQLLNP